MCFCSLYAVYGSQMFLWRGKARTSLIKLTSSRKNVLTVLLHSSCSDIHRSILSVHCYIQTEASLLLSLHHLFHCSLLCILLLIFWIYSLHSSILFQSAFILFHNTLQLAHNLIYTLHVLSSGNLGRPWEEGRTSMMRATRGSSQTW